MMKPFYVKPLLIVSIICLGLLIYSNSFSAPFQLDDKPSIIENYAIKNIHDVSTIWNSWPCRFLTYLSFALNFHFHQLDVFGYHLVNVLIHIGSALMVFWLVLLTLSTPVMRDNRIVFYANWIALFAGLIFVSHPVQTQAVTYIVQRASSLAGLLYLASLCLYVRARLFQEASPPNNRVGMFYVLALLMSILTMFTKEMAITLPLMILFYEFSFFKREQGFNWKRVAPFLGTIVIIPMTMVLTKYVNLFTMRRVIEGPQDISSFHYFLTQLRVLVTYIRLDFLPLNLNLDYDYPVSKSIFELSTLSSFLLLLGILYLAKRLYPSYRLVSFGIFWFFLTLLPESSFIPIKDVIFEHRLYLPLAGYSMFFVVSLFYLLEKRSLVAIGVILSLIVGANSFLTYERNKVWRDELTLWNDVVRKSPNKDRPINIRGIINERHGNYGQAILDYNKAIELNPRSAAPYSNRGNVYNRQGSFAQAILDYTKALELNTASPEMYNNRGGAYQKQGNIALAIADYNKAIALSPTLRSAYSNRAACFLKQGKVDQALSDLNKILYMNPDYAFGYNNRADVYEKQGDLARAMSDYTQAIKLAPDSEVFYLNRGVAYYRQGKFPEALADFNKAIQLNVKYKEGYYNRAPTYYQLKEYDKSWADLYTLEKLGGSFPALRQTLQKETGRQ